MLLPVVRSRSSLRTSLRTELVKAYCTVVCFGSGQWSLRKPALRNFLFPHEQLKALLKHTKESLY